MPERLKILFLPSWYPSARNSVAGIFVRDHAKAVNLYNDVVVLYSEGVTPLRRKLYEIAENNEEGIRTLRIRYRKSLIPKTSYFIYLFVIFRAFRKLLRDGFKPDVIHAHVYSAGVPAILLGKRYNIPVVISEHFSGFARKSLGCLEKTKAKFVFENADLVCPVSIDLKKHIKNYGIRARFRVVPNTVDMSIFSVAESARTKRDKEDLRKRMLVVALLDSKKGVPYLLEAIAQLRVERDDFILDIVGDGPNRKEYEELANSLGLADIVYFHGTKKKEEVAEFMKQCDFFVLPSLYETFGVVLIEALACGKPVVTTNVGGPNEIVTSEVGKLVPPGNSKSLAKAIDYMLDHYQKYHPEKITRYARNRYSYEAIGREWDNVYRNVLRS
ncbi:glycosyltransferase [Calderihabitans maritimus]|uniref:Putative glycosyl transferase n=1 Tax=Calderihabitans maritimus TaxID=1246530 RepID=A0A1Z5HXC9_9FIRM|nr:glycosyltransferase [Calderihabitans maritimus]GAW94017.1 putative glycosyl transferase [Calderihabitans maritimus]